MNSLNKLLLYTISIVFVGCFPAEEPIEPVERGKVEQQAISSGPSKNTIAFYDFETNSVVATARPMDWDVYVDDEVFMLNYFRSMRVAKLNAEWHEKLDTVGLSFSFIDAGDGLPKWHLSKDVIYVFDYGYDDNGKSLGFVKAMYDSQDQQLYYSPVSSAFQLVVDLSKGYYNLRSEEPINLPLRNEYDIAFGKYTDIITIGNQTEEYQIYGTLSGKCLTAEVGKSFNEVQVDEFDLITFNPDQMDQIGWDWKRYNMNINGYEILPEKSYLILTTEGYRYKMRFTSFYDENGISGHPTFEFALL